MWCDFNPNDAPGPRVSRYNYIEMSRFSDEPSEARRLFHSIAETAPDGILVIDADSVIQFANPAIQPIFGYTPEELEGRALTMLMSGEIAERHRASFKRYLQTGSKHLNWKSVELEGLRKDGSVVSVEVSFGEIQGQPHLFTGFVRDVTARRENERRLQEAEAALRASQAHIHLITDAVPALISYVDSEERYRFVNETYQRWFGSPAEQFLGRSLADVLGAEAYEQLKPAITEVLQGRPAAREAKILYPKLGWRSVRVDYIPDRVGDQVRGFVALITDMTENKQAIERREKLLAREQTARIQSETANRIKDEFLATVSHELRTPLTSIAGWAAMLEAGGLDEATSDRALAVIRRNVQAQTQLIDELLDVSSMVAGKMLLNTRPVFLGPIVETVVESFRPAAESKGITLDRIIDVHAGPVLGDSQRLQQIAWNLVSNAVKFTQRGGSIRVIVERLHSRVALKVSDSGIGLDPAAVSHVFDRFWQADSSPTRRYSGLGLGLSLARHLVELHGGSIEAFSEGRNRGATFTVSFPLQIDGNP
jgi:PAS domain S-box-containing protein